MIATDQEFPQYNIMMKLLSTNDYPNWLLFELAVSHFFIWSTLLRIVTDRSFPYHYSSSETHIDKTWVHGIHLSLSPLQNRQFCSTKRSLPYFFNLLYSPLCSSMPCYYSTAHTVKQLLSKDFTMEAENAEN